MSSKIEEAKNRSIAFYGLILTAITVGTGAGVGYVKNSSLQTKYDELSGRFVQVDAERNDAQAKLLKAVQDNAALEQRLANDGNGQLSSQLKECSSRLAAYQENDPVLEHLREVESKKDDLDGHVYYGYLGSGSNWTRASDQQLADMRQHSAEYQREIDEISNQLKCAIK